ncbi:MAG: phosphoglycolate phosphatase [Gammaproteobacteria bacterium]|nr:phosphoglycolate phosphatase [Gammaproteobacteria bacterium]
MNAAASGCRAVLFDLDGTLLDTAPDMVGALNTLLAEESRPPLAYAVVRVLVSHGSIALVQRGFPDADAGQFERLRQRYLQIYAARLTRETRLFPGFEPVLAALERRGIHWGVVTNKPGFLTEPLLTGLGLRARAACVFSGDTLPERKPHPRPLLLAAEQAGVAPPACIFVGDALRDIQAARAAGMLPLIAGFGYIDPDEDPDGWQAAGTLATPGELLDWIAPGAPADA